MTAEEWEKCINPEEMIVELLGSDNSPGTGTSCDVPVERHYLATDRKLRLLAVAWCRAADPCSRMEGDYVYTQTAESYADSLISLKTLEETTAPLPIPHWATRWLCTPDVGWCVRQVSHRLLATISEIKTNQITQCQLVREVFGNPFAPLTLPVVGYGGVVPVSRNYGRFKIRSLKCPWLTEQVTDLAEGVYQFRREDGSFDPVRLCILADALEEAGCTDTRILTHLRGSATLHFRGCFCIDLLTARK